MYLFLAVLGLCCCSWALSGCREWEPLSTCGVHTSHCNGFYCYGAQALGASQVAPVVKNPPASAGDIRDVGLIPGWRRSPGEGHGNPLWYCCLKNPMDRGAWQATVTRVAKSPT